ncbi:MAG: hypothetical protein EBZ40_03825 [Gammaproteobacteria bacterium]|nr:hypothetical protein [Gammaproteobacteria bacterium]
MEDGHRVEHLLVIRVGDHAGRSVESRAHDLAQEIAANAANSVRAAKSVVAMLGDGVHHETELSRKPYDDSFASAEFAEGARAFIEKRPPRF